MVKSEVAELPVKESPAVQESQLAKNEPSPDEEFIENQMIAKVEEPVTERPSTRPPKRIPVQQVSSVKMPNSGESEDKETEQVHVDRPKKRLGDGKAVPKLYAARATKSKLEIAQQRGGSKETGRGS